MDPLAVLNFSAHTLNPRQHPPRPLLPSRPPTPNLSYSSFSCPSLPTNLPPRPPVANSKYHSVPLYNPNYQDLDLPSCGKYGKDTCGLSVEAGTAKLSQLEGLSHPSIDSMAGVLEPSTNDSDSKPSCKIKSKNQQEKSPCSAETSKNLELMDEIDPVESCCGSSTEHQLMNPGGGHPIPAATDLPPQEAVERSIFVAASPPSSPKARPTDHKTRKHDQPQDVKELQQTNDELDPAEQSIPSPHLASTPNDMAMHHNKISSLLMSKSVTSTTPNRHAFMGEDAMETILPNITATALPAPVKVQLGRQMSKEKEGGDEGARKRNHQLYTDDDNSAVGLQLRNKFHQPEKRQRILSPKDAPCPRATALHPSLPGGSSRGGMEVPAHEFETGSSLNGNHAQTSYENPSSSNATPIAQYEEHAFSGTFKCTTIGDTVHCSLDFMSARTSEGTDIAELFKRCFGRRTVGASPVAEASMQDGRKPSSRERYTAEEDETIVRLKEEEGLSWTDMEAEIPGRSKGALKLRYGTRLRRRTVAKSISSDERCRRKTRRQAQIRSPAVQIVNGDIEKEYVVRKIKRHRALSDGSVECRVQWDGGSRTWEPYCNVKDTKAMVKYERSHGVLQRVAEQDCIHVQ
ncbi:hypothetical protein S7711_10141 [Stachybotrys chartarum IBT 7711]|uniref:Myb-like domain-containing protein n=1 Tax=Stachybotrys chartarum (strain CBS 109288 / IBT 7711) TaxID=1280523 RepID=A0A084AF05_STACB|nr:hypothetical protein S7711_10141 [Stachybotrys chartarum IBT 7711]